MNRAFRPLLVALTLASLVSSCDKKPTVITVPNDSSDTITKHSPVETNAANTSYLPAFSNQTRTFGIVTQTPIKLELLHSGLSSPWGIAQLPNGKLLVTQKGGTIAVLSASGNLLNTITNLPAVVNAGQGGLLDVYVDDDFIRNRTIYWSYTLAENGGNLTAFAKGRLNDNETSLTDISTLYKAGPVYGNSLHFGGRIIMDNSGCLLLSTGDRSDATIRLSAQRLDNGLGKIIRIKTDGSIPNNNPFLNIPGTASEIFSYGHRNVQGLAIDRFTNTIYQTELGPRGGDEVNKIVAGKNYGWPVISYGLEYTGSPIGNGITQQDQMEQPIYYWDPVISPSGMIFYSGNNIEEWRGNLIIASLSGQHLVRLRMWNNTIAGEERLFANEGQRFRDVTEGNTGEIYTITDAGRLYRITKN